MENTFILISNQVLQASESLKNTLRLRSDGFVFLYPVLLIFLFLLGRHKRRDLADLSLTLALNTVLVFVVNYLIKAFVSRPRPYKALDLPTPTEELALSTIPVDSFPSDHAGVSMTIAATLLIRAHQTRNHGLKLISRAFLIMSIIMGRGRIAIAIHRPTDILAGFVIGGMIAYSTTRPRMQKILQPVWEWGMGLWSQIIGLFKTNK